MPDKKKLNVPMIVLAVVLVAAVILAVWLFTQRSALQQEITTLNADLEASRTLWQTTSDEKEALQATLSETENALKEAQLSLEEATVRQGELDAQIAELEAAKAATKEKAPVEEAPAGKTCPICGAQADSKFCPQCGAPMGE